MRRRMHRGSYTIEAGVYIPMMMFMILLVLRNGIGFYQQSRNYEQGAGLINVDAVSEFYMYQMAEEIGKDWIDD